ncbi:MAG: SAP domain-containing protein, partial [Bacteroidota bacterium]
MDKRPPLENNISVTDFEAFYWMKAELVDFCRREGLKTSGGKIELAHRIAHYLKTGEKEDGTDKSK